MVSEDHIETLKRASLLVVLLTVSATTVAGLNINDSGGLLYSDGSQKQFTVLPNGEIKVTDDIDSYDGDLSIGANAGVGNADPTSNLEVEGDLELGYGFNEACTPNRTGALRFDKYGDAYDIPSLVKGDTASENIEDVFGVNGMTLGPNGTKMWVVTMGNNVVSYNLSVPWTPSSADPVYDVTGDFSAYDDAGGTWTESGNTQYGWDDKSNLDELEDIAWDDDGDRVYLVGSKNSESDGGVSVYDVSQPYTFEITNHRYNQDLGYPVEDIHWKPGGDKAFMLHRYSGSMSLRQYDVSIVWDLEGETFDASSGVGEPDGSLGGMDIYGNGSSVLVWGGDADSFGQQARSYDMSTAWEVNTLGNQTNHSAEHIRLDFEWGPRGERLLVAYYDSGDHSINTLYTEGDGQVNVCSNRGEAFLASNVSGNIAARGNRITNLSDPSSDQDAATKQYVDSSDNADYICIGNLC